MNNRTKLIIIVTLLACVLLGCIIWACVHFLRKSTVYLSVEPALPDGSTLIWYEAGNPNTTSIYTNRLNTFLKRYYDADPYSSDYYVNCDEGTPPKPGSNLVCLFHAISEFQPCSREYGYGFEGASRGPCIYLVFNNIPEWKPEYYNISTLPTNMPNNLKHFVQEVTAKYGSDSMRLKTVWLSCEGETAADTENIGSLIYFPIFGYGGAYFPIENKDMYFNPLVAIYFENPKHTVLINIKCKAWARNLNHEKGEGVIHFELLID